MEKDYQNFVDRMGSFEDTLEISGDELEHGRNIVTRNISVLNDESLSHFGIPGMKWGHHKSSNTINVKWKSSDGNSNTPFKVNANVIGKASKTGQDLASLGQTINKGGFNKKSVREAKNLSDDDLKQLTSRLNLENNYINAKQQQSGRSKVEGILSTVGGTLAVASSAAVLYETIKKFK